LKIKKWATNTLRWLNILLIIGTILSYMAAFVSPQSFWLLSLFGLAYPMFLVLNILFFFIFVALKSRTAILSLACILLGWHYLSVMYANNSSKVSTAENKITVCSFNVENLYTYYDNMPRGQSQVEYEDEASFSPYRSYFEQANANIICFQEYPPSNSYFKRYFQNRGFYSVEGSISIYSKYPIINQGEAIDNTKSNGAIFADLKIDTAIIRVYNVHLQSTGIAPEAQKIADEDNSIKSKKTKSSIKKIVGRLRRASQKRAEQVDEVIKHIQGSPYPVIICGDFNDTPFSYAYQQIKGNLKDSFIERGNGFGVTYNGPIPTLRIDYILGSPSLNFLSHKIINSKVSDHYPILSEISF
jgi:endonuclease/exonuclease/phosphatase family metal-dependent hydrolase